MERRRIFSQSSVTPGHYRLGRANTAGVIRVEAMQTAQKGTGHPGLGRKRQQGTHQEGGHKTAANFCRAFHFYPREQAGCQVSPLIWKDLGADAGFWRSPDHRVLMLDRGAKPGNRRWYLPPYLAFTVQREYTLNSL